MSFENVIFDLDGTLADTLPGIAASAHAAIARVLPETPMPDLRAAIGPPIATMFAQLWPRLPPEKMARLLAEFRAHYDTQGCLRSEPFPLACETLARLHAAGLRLFVLTNKPTAPARKILEHLGMAPWFVDIMGPDATQPPFRSKPDGARLLARKYRLGADATLVVGDGIDDADAAEACGFGFAAASYGYGRAAEREPPRQIAKIKKISQLLNILI
jgi:phosphoglycolate phosphatase